MGIAKTLAPLGDLQIDPFSKQTVISFIKLIIIKEKKKVLKKDSNNENNDLKKYNLMENTDNF